MGIKASILLISYNKNQELPNVFYSISRQKADFEFEVCFVDDCSYEDPKSIYDKFLTIPHKKGLRLKQHIGNLGSAHNFKAHKFVNSYGMAYDMTAKESEVIILQSSDVIWTTDNILQELVTSLSDTSYPVPRVINADVPPNAHEDFENIMKMFIERQNEYGEYQGKTRDTTVWLTPISRKIAEEIDLRGNTGEYNVTVKLQNRLKPEYRYDLLGIHQRHSSIPSVEALIDANLINWTDQNPERVIW